MRVLVSTLRRTLLVPAMLPIVFVAMASAWLSTGLAEVGLSGTEAFVDEVRQGCMLFAGVLVLSLAEPLEVARETRGGLLLLRAARGGGFGLLPRWLGLLAATLPVLALTALASGGVPSRPDLLLLELAALAAGGLALGAWLDRARLVGALWALLVASYLRPWLVTEDWSRPLAWALPALGSATGASAWGHVLLWSAGALLLADRRLAGVLARGG